MLNKNNILRFLIVILLFSSIAIATETTWRHSGFEISGYDISGASTYNLTEIRKIEFGWNTSVPAVSETSRAVMYYDDNQKRIMQSLNGGAYQAIVDNITVNFQTGNASNLTVGTVADTRLSMNYSRSRDCTNTSYYDVKCWGAVGDNAADDFVPIQAAINESNSTGIPVYIPAGNYNLSSNCLRLYDGGGDAVFTKIYGDGESSKLINRCSAGKPTLLVEKDNYMLSDFAVNGVSGFPNTGINLSTANFGNLERITINSNANGSIGEANLVLNTVVTVRLIRYISWQSGRPNGASQNNPAGISYGILANGQWANDITIDGANIVNANTNFSAIKWDTSGVSNGFRIINSELENNHEAVNISRNAYDFMIKDNYMDNANVNISAHVSDTTDPTIRNVQLGNCLACSIWINGTITFVDISHVNTPNFVWIGRNVTNITLISDYFQTGAKYQAGTGTCYFNVFAPTKRNQGCVDTG